jgi:hypothetical protein
MGIRLKGGSMKRIALLFLVIGLLSGCASTMSVKYKPDPANPKKMIIYELTTTDTAVAINSDGAFSSTPSRMFNGSDLTKIAEHVLGYIDKPCPECPVCPPAPTPTPNPVPTPTPNPAPVPVPTPTPTGNLTLLDMSTAAGELRNYVGVPASDGSYIYVAMCHELAPGWESWSPEGPDGEALRGTGDKMRQWLTNKINAVVADLRADPGKTVTVVANDVDGTCGSRVGPPVAQRIKDAGISPGRVSMGVIYYP